MYWSKIIYTITLSLLLSRGEPGTWGGGGGLILGMQVREDDPIRVQSQHTTKC